MPIYIDSIKAKGLGPISSIDWKFSKFNLIYGKNERGKTHLVEFFIRSLFKSSRHWSLRNTSASGRVMIHGLPGGPMGFSPRTTGRLDDVWENDRGLPEDFSRLLVVKGAETEIVVDADGGIDRSTIKHFISGQQALERIEKRIPKTVQESSIESTRITGSRRGEIKDREILQERLTVLNQLIQNVNKRFSGGQRQVLEKERAKVATELEAQNKARKILAGRIQHQVDSLEEQKRQISRDTLQKARDELNLLRQKQRETVSRKNELDLAREKSRHHEWLQNATRLYEALMMEESVSVGYLLPVLAILSAIAAGITTVTGIWQGALAGLFIMAATVMIIVKRLHNLVKRRGQSDEVDRLKEQYKIRFNEELTGLPQLREQILLCQEDYAKAKLLDDQLASDRRLIDQYEVRLEQLIFRLTGQKHGPDTWESVLLETAHTLETFENSLQTYRIQLAQLDVEPVEYIAETSDVVYDRLVIEKLEIRKNNIDQQILSAEQQLDDLKRSIFQEIRDKNARNWSDLLESLRIKRDETAAEYALKTAQIIGKKLVYRVIQELEQDEDEKLADALSHSAVQAPLFAMTGRYNSFELEADGLMVSDGLSSYTLTDLSSGAREQVLLALRIGFGAHLLGDDAAFIILDDAFQYSDWSRRKLLVEQMLKLTEQGWQIIYFTMDDHIKELFKTTGAPLGKDFTFLEL
ncbi:hypothetical protein KAR48_13070 [bacterium]|nr:hypothetical protein [bacterium]